MAGARAQLDSGALALVPPAWTCSTEQRRCVTPVLGQPLVVTVPAIGGRLNCDATYRGKPVACTMRLWYAPRLKFFLELGRLPGVTFRGAILERPWRLLDLGLLGEQGPLHVLAGFIGFFFVALAAGAIIRDRGWWWLLRGALSIVAYVVLNMAWFIACVFLGYID